MEKSFSECILLKINHFEAIFYRGRINLIKGFVKEAQNDFEKILKTNKEEKMAN